MDPSLQSLRDLVLRLYPLPEPEMEALLTIWVPFAAKRKALLTSPGDTEKYLYFVEEGVQRVFYTAEDGREATLVFMYPPSFAGVLDSFLLQQPSRYYFETLSPSRFLRTSYHQLGALMRQYPEIDRMIRSGLTVTFSGILERLTDLQCRNAEERFRILLKRSPQVLQLIPHKYLANYLGMDPTHFSKLMGSVRIE